MYGSHSFVKFPMVLCAPVLVPGSHVSALWSRIGGITSITAHLLPHLGTRNWIKTIGRVAAGGWLLCG